MSILIKELHETKYTMADVHSLIKEVYSKRADEGIHFQALSKTTEEIEKRIKDNNGIVYVAIDQENSRLLGTGTILFFEDKDHALYAGLVLAAVRPDAQGQGIGKMIRLRRETCAKERGCVYISSSTAEKAISSVEYHLKTGSRKYGFFSSPNSDYYSILFRKYFKTTFQGSVVYCCVRYNLSRIITKFLFYENGTRKPFGVFLFRFLNIIRGKINK